MLFLLVVVLFVLWLLGFTVLHLGSLIHILLIVAAVVFIYRVLVNGEPRNRL